MENAIAGIELSIPFSSTSPDTEEMRSHSILFSYLGTRNPKTHDAIAAIWSVEVAKSATAVS